ncbi:hypothetical protein FB446DRAFT_726917 [Lentinula raphanica]|nr:hypothetical protein C8R42DRAFT_717311 [Lentinula raphanica]KAJ3775018.1 hypothetical protein FB446DRAFT_726917 [Lentinula raphanica]
MTSFSLRSALFSSSHSLRLQNAVRLPASTSLFLSRSLSTSFVNRGPSSRFVYLGNIPWSLEIEEIKHKAERFGKLESIDMPSDDYGRPSGFANVEFASPEEAQNFYRAAQETSLSFNGRRTRVELFDEPQKEVVKAKQNPPSNTIWIGRIPHEATADDLREMFSPFGSIKRLAFADRDSSRMFAHVEYETTEQALAAMSAVRNDGTTLLGQQLLLDFAPPKPADTPTSQLYFSRYNGDLSDLKAALSQSPGVNNIVMLKNRNGIIFFNTVEEATAARQALDRTQTPDGHNLNLFYSNPRSRPQDGESRPGNKNMSRSNNYRNNW